MSQASDFLRKAFGEGDAARDAGLSTPEGIERFDDIVYGTEADWQVLDVYRPKAAAGERLPVILNVHGGGWVYGNKEAYQHYCMSLAGQGFAVVNFTYRLAPEFLYPANLEDTNLAVQWVLANAEAFLLDTEHIFAVGDSAGAQILASYAAICTNPDYAAGFPFAVPAGFSFTAIALNCGVYLLNDPALLDPMTAALRADQMPEGGTEAEYTKASPVNWIAEHFPPTLYMTCSGDFLKQQAPLLEAALAKVNVPHEFHYLVSAEEELGHVFHLNVKSGEAARCNGMECGYFKSFLETR